MQADVCDLRADARLRPDGKGKMKLKTDASGNAVLQDGKPVYVNDDGTEVALDPPAMYEQVRRLTTENRDKRLKAKELEDKLATLEGIENPDEAREALEIVKSLGGKTKADIEKIRADAKAEVSKAYQAKLDAEAKRSAELQKALDSELIGGGFARSKFIAERLAIPSDIAQAAFGSKFSVENGKLVAKDASGLVINSRSNPAEPASFDEALEILVSSYPHKDSILRATQKSGTGAQPVTGGGGGEKTMTRAEFDKLSPPERSAALKGGTKLTE